MRRKEKLGGKSEDKWLKSEGGEKGKGRLLLEVWRQTYSGVVGGESNYKLMVGWSQQVHVEGLVLQGGTLAFSMEPRPMLKMPSGARSF